MLSAEDITGCNGMPLSIIGASEVYETSIYPRNFNKHHPEHPNADPLLSELVGRVVRHSRVQIMPVAVHDAYHNLGISPVLLADESEQFRLTLLHHADCLAENVLDLSEPSKPVVRPIEPIDLKKIWVKPEMGNVGIDGQWDSRRKTGLFLALYLIKQGMEQPKGVINKFLDTTDPDLKLQLAWQLIHGAAEVAVKPVEPIYRQSVIHEGSRKRPLKKLTSVLFSIFTPEYLPDYVHVMQEQLQLAA